MWGEDSPKTVVVKTEIWITSVAHCTLDVLPLTEERPTAQRTGPSIFP
jgi:hypothetical protein